MSPLVYLRLSLMMFLQYAVWGAWLPVAGRYLKGGLGFDSGQIGLILGVGASVGAILAPFIAGQFADRYFSTERCLAVFILLGGAVNWFLAEQTSYPAWLGLAIAYSIVFMPTLSLSNSLAFAHLPDRSKQFPYVRVWGTIGWIAASWAFPWLYLQTNLQWQAMPPFLAGPEVPDAARQLSHALKFSALIAFGYGLFCFLLPHTPPKRDAVEKLAFAKAFALFGRPSFAVLVVVSLAVAGIHQIYFIETGSYFTSIHLRESDIGPAMTIGQFAELLILPLLGFFLKGLGFRWVISLGALAYFIRFSIFALGADGSLPVWAVVSSQAFHGLCYSCFFAATYIYVDRIAPADVRHSAQTLIGILLLGGGPILGGQFYAWLVKFCTVGGTLDYAKFWYIIGGIGLGASVIVALLFRDETAKTEPAGATS